MGNPQPNTCEPTYAAPKFGAGGVSGTGSNQLFDIPQIDAAIAQRGVKLIHAAAMPCPVGRNSREDSTRRSHPDHAGCQGGFIYTTVGEATCLFTNNTKSKNWVDQGLADNDRVLCTFPRFYDGTQTDVKVVPYDRLYLAEPGITVVQWELAEYSGSGFDAFKYPVVDVQSLIDWRGEYYRQGVDFTVESGKIHWGSRAPGLNPFTGSGAVYSIRYTYRPYYIVDALQHEVRVASSFNPLTGEKTVIPMPYQVTLVRENVRRNADNDVLSPAAKSRQQPSDADVDFTEDTFTPPTAD